MVALSFERLAQAPLLLPGDPVIVLQLDGTAERRALASMDGKMAEFDEDRDRNDLGVGFTHHDVAAAGPGYLRWAVH